MIEKQLQERLSLLRLEREQTRLTVIAYDGAIQECEHWLKILNDTFTLATVEDSKKD